MTRFLLAAVLICPIWAAPADGPVVLSLSIKRNPVRLSDGVTILVTLTNQTDEPRYVFPSVDQRLEFAVRDPDDKVVRGFPDPPLPPEVPVRSPEGLVRIDGKRSLTCFINMPLAHLGIRRAGTFTVFGGWEGLALRGRDVDARSAAEIHDAYAHSHAEAVKLVVAGNRLPANIGVQPPAQTLTETVPPCADAGAPGRHPD